MIKHTTVFEKAKLYKEQKEALMLLTLTGQKIHNPVEQQNRTTLNISISIDISGSMAEGINQQNYDHPPFDMRNIHSIINHDTFNRPILKTKLQQAQEAAIKALHAMQNGDWLSIVAFDHQSYVIVPATQLTSDNRQSIINKIQTLRVAGSTNLHEGWLTSATEVAKNVSSKSLNRVLVLTDGQTNAGIVSLDEIATNVSKLYLKSISTTTFGIGSGFNEDLLQAMSNSGGGNFYYIDDENKLNDMFTQEFLGLSNIAASEISVSLALNPGFSVSEQLNKLTLVNGKYVIPSLSDLQKMPLLFKLSTTLTEGTVEVGHALIEYKDQKGEFHAEKLTLSVEVTTKDIWDTLPYDSEVKVQETLMIVANNKTLVTQALDKGDRSLAEQLLNTSNAFIGSTGLSDSRLHAETMTLNATISASANMSSEVFRKTVSNQSYMTRYSKD